MYLIVVFVLASLSLPLNSGLGVTRYQHSFSKQDCATGQAFGSICHCEERSNLKFNFGCRNARMPPLSLTQTKLRLFLKFQREKVTKF